MWASGREGQWTGEAGGWGLSHAGVARVLTRRCDSGDRAPAQAARQRDSKAGGAQGLRHHPGDIVHQRVCRRPPARFQGVAAALGGGEGLDPLPLGLAAQDLGLLQLDLLLPLDLLDRG